MRSLSLAGLYSSIAARTAAKQAFICSVQGGVAQDWGPLPSSMGYSQDGLQAGKLRTFNKCLLTAMVRSS